LALTFGMPDMPVSLAATGGVGKTRTMESEQIDPWGRG
jgi:hypothetical protein